MIDTGLSGKRVLITGTNNPEGIGAATARAFAEQGARLLLTYLEPDEPADPTSPPSARPSPERYAWLNRHRPDRLVEELRASGAAVEAAPFDLGDPDGPSAAFDWARDVAGAVDVIVSNAATFEPDSFDPATSGGEGIIGVEEAGELSGPTLDAHLAVNARAPALLISKLARSRKVGATPKACVINISTDAAICHAGAASYAASKSALESLSRTAAWELARYGVRVNVIAPGPVQTGWIEPEVQTALEASIPAGRLGTPEDVAHAGVFLASVQALWITGQVLYVGGGHVMR